MQERNYSGRLTVEQLAEMNSQPKKQAEVNPTTITLTLKEWSTLMNSLTQIAKTNAEIKDEMDTIRYSIPKEVTDTVKFETRMALHEQQKEMWQKISDLTREAKEQVGRAADSASRRMERRAFWEDSIWWAKLIVYGTIFVMAVILFLRSIY